VLGEKLIKFLKPAHLLIADRHFGVAPIIYKLFDASVPFLIRSNGLVQNADRRNIL